MILALHDMHFLEHGFILISSESSILNFLLNRHYVPPMGVYLWKVLFQTSMGIFPLKKYFSKKKKLWSFPFWNTFSKTYGTFLLIILLQNSIHSWILFWKKLWTFLSLRSIFPKFTKILSFKIDIHFPKVHGTFHPLENKLHFFFPKITMKLPFSKKNFKFWFSLKRNPINPFHKNPHFPKEQKDKTNMLSWKSFFQNLFFPP